MRSLMWFRNDLRLADNTALSAAAAQSNGEVVAVFLVAMKQWTAHDWGAPKIDFILRNLAAMRQALSQLNIPLRVLTADHFTDAAPALRLLAEQERCDALFFNREYELNEAARDEEVTKALTAAGTSVHAFHDQTVVPPDELRTGAGQFYRVFTPFKNAWLASVKSRWPLTLSSLQRSRRADTNVKPREKNLPELAPMLEHAQAPPGMASRWPAGELEAARRLESFIRNRIQRYKEDRDFPALDGTSALSPYLSAGVISPRQCLVAAVRAGGGKIDGPDPGVTTWISELIWREFYRHVLVGFPRLSRRQPFRQETRAIRWREDEEGFRAWCEGRTGVPIVDAAMRQLLDTGWMHNRLRMITAMFLTKDLFIDWRKGERFFMEHLVDADLAQNNGGWQWSASTGTDAAPYFRIFNPYSQSERFDPRGSFIRQYCPELAELDDDMIHDPSKLPPLRRNQLDYPPPIVDHAAARTRVIEAFKAIK